MQVPTGYITSLKAHAHTLPLPSAAGVAAVVRLGHGPHRAALRLHLPCNQTVFSLLGHERKRTEERRERTAGGGAGMAGSQAQ